MSVYIRHIERNPIAFQSPMQTIETGGMKSKYRVFDFVPTKKRSELPHSDPYYGALKLTIPMILYQTNVNFDRAVAALFVAFWYRAVRNRDENGCPVFRAVGCPVSMKFHREILRSVQ